MRRHRRPTREDAELNITAFLNLMIVLVPVLLLSLVFNTTTIIDLQLPGKADLQPPLNAQEIQLEIVIRETELLINTVPGGLYERIVKTEQGFDYDALTQALRKLKNALGREKRDISILAESTTAYQVIVSVMDHARSYPEVVAASLVDAALFPQISLADAPAPADGSADGESAL